MLIQPSWPRRLPLFVFLCYLIYSDFHPRKIPHNTSETCIIKGGYNSKLLLERQNEGMWRSLLLLLSITHKIKYSCHGLSSLGRKVERPRKHKNTSSFSMGLSFQPHTLTVTFRLRWVGCRSQSFRFNTNTHTHTPTSVVQAQFGLSHMKNTYIQAHTVPWRKSILPLPPSSHWTEGLGFSLASFLSSHWLWMLLSYVRNVVWLPWWAKWYERMVYQVCSTAMRDIKRAHQISSTAVWQLTIYL